MWQRNAPNFLFHRRNESSTSALDGKKQQTGSSRAFFSLFSFLSDGSFFLSYADDSALPFSSGSPRRELLVALSSATRRGEAREEWTRGCFHRTARLSEGFKGRREIRPFPPVDRANGEARMPPVNLYHISESFVGLASA